MLTHRQAALLRYLTAWQEDGHGVSPSFEQMQRALNLKSKSGIHRLIVSLEERGYIERMRHRARAIRVVSAPDGQPLRPINADDLIEMVTRLCNQEGPEVTIAALADASSRVAALFLSTEGNA